MSVDNRHQEYLRGLQGRARDLGAAMQGMLEV